MQFTLSTPTENFPTRYVSKKGRWELGILPTICGTHCIGISPIGDDGVVRHYCCGPTQAVAEATLILLQDILWAWPEEITVADLNHDLPDGKGNIQLNGVYGNLQYMAKMAKWVKAQLPSEQEGVPSNG
jgi:hypothetical protein